MNSESKTMPCTPPSTSAATSVSTDAVVSVANIQPMTITAVANPHQGTPPATPAVVSQGNTPTPTSTPTPIVSAQPHFAQPAAPVVSTMTVSAAPAPQGIQTMTSVPSPLHQVQVIQQPLHNPTYLQHLYSPHQQMLLPGNLTIQSAMGPTLQNLGTHGLSLHLQGKATLDHKGQATGHHTLIPASQMQAAENYMEVHPTLQGVAISSANLMSAAGQMITAGGKTCMPAQMFTTAGKSSAVIQGQSAFPPPTSSQTVVIGQLGVLSNQPSLVPANNKAMTDNHKGKQYVTGHTACMPMKSPTYPLPKMMSQQATLQPKSPILPSPATSGVTTAQVLTGTQLKQLTSSPQIMTSQAPAAMIASQAQILGSLQALGASLPQGLTWAPPGLQTPAYLTQNPIFIRSQQSDMFIQSPQPTATAALHALPMATNALPPAIPQLQKQKQVRPASSVATQTAVSTAVTVHSHLSNVRPQAKPRSRTQTNRTSPAPGGVAIRPHTPQTATTQTQTQTTPHHNLKADAANQTKMNHATTATEPQPNPSAVPASLPQHAAAQTQSRSTSTEIKQCQPIAPKIDTATVAPVQPQPMPVQRTSVSAGTNTSPVLASTAPPTPPPLQIVEDMIPEADEPPAEAVAPVAEQKSDTTAVPLVEKKSTTTEVEEVLPLPPAPALDSAVKEKHPQKAIVKPHVLTHIIEGYIIQEGSEPFPVSRSSLLTDNSPPKMTSADKSAEMEVTHTGKGKRDKSSKTRGPVELAKCEFCGKLGAKSKFKRSKRFCSTSCAKRYNVGCSKRLNLFTQATNPEDPLAQGKVAKKKKLGFKSRKGWRKSQSGRLSYNISEWQNQTGGQNMDMDSVNSLATDCMNMKVGGLPEAEGETTDTPSGPESSMSPTTPSSHREEMEVDMPDNAPVFSSKSPVKWSVQEVADFVRALPGCTDYADEFRSQEIDGQALLLLKEDHLMTAMSMKLGPALKICARINSLKDELGRS